VVISEGAHPRGKGLSIAEEREHPDGLPVLGGAGHGLRRDLEAIYAEEARRVVALGSYPPEAPEIRVVVLGHIQRGGTPDSGDRIIATACGSYAVEMVTQGLFGYMSAWKNDGPTHVPLVEATVPHLVDPETDPLVEVARSVGICLGD